jgi:hypothetical protein
MATFDLKNAVILIKDGTGAPNTLTVNLGEGTLQYTERRNLTYRKNRGVLDDVVLGDEEPVDVQIDAVWEYLKASTGGTPTIEDVLKKRGEAADWTSTDADTCRPYAVDIEITLTPPCSADDKEIILLENFRWEEIQHNANEGQLSITGKCNVTEASVTRTSQVTTT